MGGVLDEALGVKMPVVRAAGKHVAVANSLNSYCEPCHSAIVTAVITIIPTMQPAISLQRPAGVHSQRDESRPALLHTIASARHNGPHGIHIYAYLITLRNDDMRDCQHSRAHPPLQSV